MSKYASKEQLTALVADMASKINIAGGTEGVSGSYTPVGTIIAYMGTSAPADHLACDGSLHQIASYPQLADFFYENFGASNYFGGNGTSTFAVPDLRGEFLRGTGTNSHANQGNGANVGTHQDGTINMENWVDYNGKNFQIAGSDSYIRTVNPDYQYTNKKGVGVGTNTYNFNDSTNGAYTSRPTNTSILWCIKAVDYKVPEDRKQDYYSTEEVAVGKWIDGSTVFQKTYDISNIATMTAIDDFSNKELLEYSAVYKIPSGDILPVPYFAGDTVLSIGQVGQTGKLNFVCSVANFERGRLKITARYLKIISE